MLDAADQPLSLCFEIIEDRNYARAKQMVEQVKSVNDLPPNDPYVEMVLAIQKAELPLIAEEQRARREASGKHGRH